MKIARSAFALAWLGLFAAGSTMAADIPATALRGPVEEAAEAASDTSMLKDEEGITLAAAAETNDADVEDHHVAMRGLGSSCNWSSSSCSYKWIKTYWKTKRDWRCWDVKGNKPWLNKYCNGSDGGQQWHWDRHAGWLKSKGGKCVTYNPHKYEAHLYFTDCDYNKHGNYKYQQFYWKNYRFMSKYESYCIDLDRNNGKEPNGYFHMKKCGKGAYYDQNHYFGCCY